MKILKKHIEELKKSITYSMSLGSMELFHTNFWAFIIKKYPEFASVFIGEDYRHIKENGVIREKKLSCQQSLKQKYKGNGNKSVDIFIVLNDNSVYVIENKFKSIPTKSQLEMYYELLETDKKYTFNRGILVAPFQTSIVENGKNIVLSPGIPNYSFVSYEDVINHFEMIAKEYIDKKNISENERFDMSIILSYCNDVRNILELIKLGPIKDYTDEKYRIYASNMLDSVGLNDLCYKLSVEGFIQYFSNRYEQEGMDKIYGKIGEGKTDFVVRPGFSRKHALIDFVFDSRIRDNDDDYVFIGIQIQGNQYRRCYERAPERGESPEKIYQSVISDDNEYKRAWFGECKDNLVHWGVLESNKVKICPYSSSMQDKMCKYGMFIYQHKNYLENGSIKYSQLYEMIMSDIKLAKKIYDYDMLARFQSKKRS